MDEKTRAALRALAESGKQLEGMTLTSEVCKPDTLNITFRGGGAVQVTGIFNLQADMPQPEVDTRCDGCTHYVHEASTMPRYYYNACRKHHCMLNGNERCTPCMSKNSKNVKPQPQPRPDIHCEGCTYLKYNQARTAFACSKYCQPLLSRDVDNAVVQLADCVIQQGKRPKVIAVAESRTFSIGKLSVTDCPGGSGEVCCNCGSQPGMFSAQFYGNKIHLCADCFAGFAKIIIDALT